MTGAELLTWLAESDRLYAHKGRPASEVIADADAWIGERAWLIEWALIGQASGHEWLVCSECGVARLMKASGLKDKEGKRCRMTWHCPGHMVRIAKRPRLTKATIEALAQ